MKSVKNLYLYFSTMLFVMAALLSATSVQATCYTCTSSDPGGCPAAQYTGMTGCTQSQDCYIFGAPCGKGWDIE